MEAKRQALASVGTKEASKDTAKPAESLQPGANQVRTSFRVLGHKSGHNPNVASEATSVCN